MGKIISIIMLVSILVFSCVNEGNQTIRTFQKSLSVFSKEVEGTNYSIVFKDSAANFSGILYRNSEGCFIMAPEPFYDSNVWINIEILPDSLKTKAGSVDYVCYKVFGSNNEIFQHRRLDVVSLKCNEYKNDTTYIIDYYFYDSPPPPTSFKFFELFDLRIAHSNIQGDNNVKVRFRLTLPKLNLVMESYEINGLSRYSCPFLGSNKLNISL